MSRFYTNPFRKGAEMAHIVSVSEPRFDGHTHTALSGSWNSWSRTVTYSDGTVRNEEVKREYLDHAWFFGVKFR